MKKIKIGAIFLAVTMVIMGQRLDGVSNPLKSSIFARAIISCQAKIACLQAGYEYTQEEKDNAREEITLLEDQQAAMLQQYNEINACQDLSAQEKDEHVHSVALGMYRLNDDIKELQLITGDAWSDDRKRAWGFVALIAAGLVTYKFFGPSIIAFVTKNGKNSDKLSTKQKEQDQQLKEQQQKQLLDEKNAKKEANRVAQKKADKKRVKETKQLEDKKENLRRIDEEAQKRAEHIVKIKEQKRQEEAEKAEKRAREELFIINNKNIFDARERISDIKKEIIGINNSHKDGGEVDQNSDSKRQLLEGQLKQEEDNLQNCIFKEKANRYDNEQRLIFERKKLAEQRKQDQIDWICKMSIKLGISILNTSVKVGEIIVQLAKDGFVALNDRSCLSKEDQEAIRFAFIP